jgi:hypothetical protein
VRTGGKEQLYVAVLEQAYSQIRDAELTIDVERLEPIAAIRRLAEPARSGLGQLRQQDGTPGHSGI